MISVDVGELLFERRLLAVTLNGMTDLPNPLIVRFKRVSLLELHAHMDYVLKVCATCYWTPTFLLPVPLILKSMGNFNI